MTLEEAIRHAKEVAEEKRKDYERACALNIPSDGCYKCAKEHEQLAEWLEELKTLRKAYDLACKNSFGCWDAYENQIDCSDKSCFECFKEYYMQKAREDDENNNIP